MCPQGVIICVFTLAVPRFKWLRYLVPSLSRRRHLVQYQGTPCVVCIEKSGTGADVSPNTLVVSCQYHPFVLSACIVFISYQQYVLLVVDRAIK